MVGTFVSTIILSLQSTRALHILEKIYTLHSLINRYFQEIALLFILIIAFIKSSGGYNCLFGCFFIHLQLLTKCIPAVFLRHSKTQHIHDFIA